MNGKCQMSKRVHRTSLTARVLEGTAEAEHQPLLSSQRGCKWDHCEPVLFITSITG